MKAQLKLVWIEWDDSLGGGGWCHISVHKSEVSRCVSSGVLIEDHKDHVTVSCSVSIGEDGSIRSVCDAITIPRCCIRRIKRIKM